MTGWYIRPSSQDQHLLTWSTGSIGSSIASSWSSTLSRVAKVSTALMVVVGAGLLYAEYLHRLDMVERQEARQRRLVRKLLERQRINRNPIPIYQVQEKRDRSYPDCAAFPPDLICRNQLYQVWGALPPAKELWERRRRMQGERRMRRTRDEKRDMAHRQVDRGDPDGGEDDTKNDDPSMDEVIQSAREVRRLICESPRTSFSCSDFQPESVGIGNEFADYDEEFHEDSQDYLLKTKSDFRDLLQLTSIDDTWSDTRSIRQPSVISHSSMAPRQTRRQSVLSCSSVGEVDFETWDWEDMASMETNQSMELVIRCGEIVTSDTNIKM